MDQSSCGLVNSQTPPLTVTVNRLKISNALKAFVDWFSGMPTYLHSGTHLLAMFQNTHRSKQLYWRQHPQVGMSVSCPSLQ